MDSEKYFHKEDNMDINKEIGARIRIRREFLGFTREDLAERADISTQFLADIEVGRKSMTALTIIGLAKSLCISTDYILLGTRCDNDMALFLKSKNDASDTDAPSEDENGRPAKDQPLIFEFYNEAERKGAEDILKCYVKTISTVRNSY